MPLPAQAYAVLTRRIILSIFISRLHHGYAEIRMLIAEFHATIFRVMHIIPYFIELNGVLLQSFFGFGHDNNYQNINLRDI